MKSIPLALCAAALALLASCTSPVVRRIEHNPDLFKALSVRHQTMVQQGEIEEGMTKPAVFLAWGRPDRASKGSEDGRSLERWSYVGYSPEYVPGAGWGARPIYYRGRGCGYGGWGYDTAVFYEPMGTYVPYEAGFVVFRDGKVKAWSR